VDIDGTLCDQCYAAIKQINKRCHLHIKHSDITAWNKRIGDTQINLEIEKTLRKRSAVMKIPLIKNAKHVMNLLFKNGHYIIIATSRIPEAEKGTIDWLNANFKFHQYINTCREGKGRLKADVLIDDYVPNINAFARNGGIGILLEQPWNKDTTDIADLIADKKVYVAKDWLIVLKLINQMAAWRSTSLNKNWRNKIGGELKCSKQ
jgi:5'(3')-deoxyribonucleotidase